MTGPVDTVTSPQPAGRSRRELTMAVLGAALSGGLALSASGQPWADLTLTREPPLPTTTAVLTGSDAAPLVGAAGLLLLASALAVIAVRGLGRLVVGLFVAAAGGVLVWSGLRGLTGGLDPADADLGSAGGLGRAEITSDAVAGWPALTVVAGLVGLLAGVLVVLRGRGWPGMGRRYERAGQQDTAPARTAAAPARPQTPEDRHQAAWKALDRGEDPTVG